VDPERAGSPAREQEDVVDETVRWDAAAAPTLQVRGPVTVRRLSALAFVPGPDLGGSVVLARTDGTTPPTRLPDLDAFLAATAGPGGTTNVDVALAPAALLLALGPAGPGLTLGDPDTDDTHDYVGHDRRLDPVIELSARERLAIAYEPPPGPGTGLDQTAVVYLRVNAP
jgi:hypothetical protein